MVFFSRHWEEILYISPLNILHVPHGSLPQWRIQSGLWLLLSTRRNRCIALFDLFVVPKVGFSFSIHLVAFLVACKVELFLCQDWQSGETLTLVFPWTLTLFRVVFSWVPRGNVLILFLPFPPTASLTCHSPHRFTAGSPTSQALCLILCLWFQQIETR